MGDVHRGQKGQQRYWQILFLTVAYVIGGRLGLVLSDPQTNITLVWPATGIAVAALFRWGYQCWPGVYLGAVIVERSLGYPLGFCCGIAAGNTLGPMLAVWLLHRFDFQPSFERREEGPLLIGAAVVGMLISGAGGALNLCLQEMIPWSAYGPAFLGWWLGDSAGVLLIGPLLLTMTRQEWFGVRERKWEFIGMSFAIGLAVILVFMRPDTAEVVWGRLAFLTLPLVVWGSLRFGPIGSGFSALLLSALSALATAMGLGPFYGHNMQHGGFLLWAFTVTAAFTGLMITSLQAERKRIEHKLEGQRDLLEAIRQVHSRFITSGDTRAAFDQMVHSLLRLTRSKEGFICEVHQQPDGRVVPRLRSVTRAPEDDSDTKSDGFGGVTEWDYFEMEPMLTSIVASGQPLIVNDPASESRLGIMPAQNPPLKTFLALPLFQGGVLLGVAGIANRPGGYHSRLCRELAPLVATFAGLIDTARARRREQEAEMARHASEERFAAFMRTMPLVAFMKDTDGRLVYINEAFEREFKIKFADWQGKTDAQIWPPQTATQLRKHDEIVLKSGQPLVVDEIIERPGSGIQHWVSYKFLFVDAQGRRYLAGSAINVTERKQAEIKLRDSEERFRAMCDQMPDSVFLFDLDDPTVPGRILYANKSAELMHGVPIAEMTGRPMADFDEPNTPSFSPQRIALLRHGETVRFHTRRRRADGRLFPVEVVARITSTLGRNVVITIDRDLTELVRAEETRQLLEEQLRQAQKMEAIGQLAGGVAHDFNNILTIIQGNALLLLTLEGGRTQFLEHVNQIVDASERAAGLTRQLLLFGRKQVMQPRDLDLSEVVGDILKMLQRILGEDIALRSDCSPHVPLVHADVGMIEQVLLNLAVNARDAMPNGGLLVVGTSVRTLTADDTRTNPEARPGQHVVLSVRDNGTGITPEVLPHIFEPFFTTKEVGKGSGLGLATVYGIVNQHHGWVEVSSEMGKGTTFQVYLPAVREHATTRAERVPVQKPPGGKETILVVEDEAALRLLVVNLLQRWGYTVVQAVSGLAALDVWAQYKDGIQLLLTDIVMPDGVSGTELAARLLAEKPELKVIYTSGYSASLAGRELELEEGVNFLAKPYPPQKLAQMIRDCLDAQKPQN